MSANRMIQQTRIRRPAVAGLFYPDRPDVLDAAVRQFMEQVDPALRPHADDENVWPKAIIGPHAGYRYSGPIAASAYTPVQRARGHIRRVVMISPSHRAAFTGLALSSAEAFACPGHTFPVDADAIEQVRRMKRVHVLDEAHAPEHGLEVHLPFLAWTLGPPTPDPQQQPAYTIVPMLFGQVDHETVADVFEALWGGPETLFLISSDLSHYLDYDTAKRVDRATSDAILAGEADGVGPTQACGHTAIQALMRVADDRGLAARNLDLRNSGDTAGPRHEVVGYGAFTFN